MVDSELFRIFVTVIERVTPHKTTIIMDGRYASLKEPYRGYTNIILVQYWSTMYKWEVEICGSGKHIFVYDDEFELD